MREWMKGAVLAAGIAVGSEACAPGDAVIKKDGLEQVGDRRDTKRYASDILAGFIDYAEKQPAFPEFGQDFFIRFYNDTIAPVLAAKARDEVRKNVAEIVPGTNDHDRELARVARDLAPEKQLLKDVVSGNDMSGQFVESGAAIRDILRQNGALDKNGLLKKGALIKLLDQQDPFSRKTVKELFAALQSTTNTVIANK